MSMLGKWLMTILVLLGIAATVVWSFRVDLALFAVSMMMDSRYEIGPNQLINWSTGSDLPQRDVNERPPNIILILADDLGWNDISVNGGENATIPTPSIDALAASGATFNQGYAANGTCAPSRAALMSGRYGTRFGFEFTPTPLGMPQISGLIASDAERPLAPQSFLNPRSTDLDFNDMGMPASEITLAELLSNLGYHTVHIGKWHLGRTNGMAAHDQGFRESLLMASGLYGKADDPDVINARQDFDPIDQFQWAAYRFAASFNGGPAFEPRGYLTDYYTEEAVKIIEANKDRPFFLYLAHWAPHTPLQASRQDYEALDHITLHRERVYAAMIRSLDRGVGQVMDALRKHDLEENTLVLFTSDNGGAGYIGLPNVNDPYRGWKISLFEGGIRVPFLAKWPAKIAPGSHYDEPVHHFDMYATAAAAAGAKLPEDRIIDGVDLIPQLLDNQDEIEPPHQYLFFRSGAAQAVRDTRWKLMVSAPPDGIRKEWLFDLDSTTPERENLLAKHPAIVKRLRQALTNHNAEQMEPLWPWTVTMPINIDRDLSKPDEAGDEFAYWSN